MFKYFADKQPIEDLPFILATFGYTKREVKSLMSKGEKIKQQQDYLGSLSRNFVFRNWKENGDLQKEVENQFSDQLFKALYRDRFDFVFD